MFNKDEKDIKIDKHAIFQSSIIVEEVQLHTFSVINFTPEEHQSVRYHD